MSDWLERELARGLAPVAAPDTLRIRLGFAPARRWEFPRVALAVAAAVVTIIAGGYAASRTPALDLRHLAAHELRGAQTVEFTSLDPVAAAWPGREAGTRCDGGATMPLQLNAGKATVLLAHYGFEMPAHNVAAAPDAGCNLCHSL